MRFDKTRLGMAFAMLAALALAIGVSACGSSSDSSDSTASETGEGGSRDRLQPGQRQGEPDDRLEELPRTGNPRRNLHPGLWPRPVTRPRATSTSAPKRSPSRRSSRVRSPATRSTPARPSPRSSGSNPKKFPPTPTGAYEKAKAEFEKEGLTAFPPTPFASANAVGTLKKTAEKYGLEDISDLEGVSEKLSLYGSPECRQRIDCLAGLEELYGLKFKSFNPVDISLRYTVLEKGQADLSILFTTDPQLSAEKDKFVILEDDKHVFPAGNVIFVTTPKVVDEGGARLRKDDRRGPEGPDAAGHAGARRSGRTRKADAEGSGRGLPEVRRLHRLGQRWCGAREPQAFARSAHPGEGDVGGPGR